MTDRETYRKRATELHKHWQQKALQAEDEDERMYCNGRKDAFAEVALWFVGREQDEPPAEG